MISLCPFCLHAEFCIAVASRKIQSLVPLAELLVRSPFPDELVWVPVAFPQTDRFYRMVTPHFHRKGVECEGQGRTLGPVGFCGP